MNIREEVKDGELFLLLDGSFDETSSPDIEDALEEVMAGDVEVVNFDLSKVRYISSAGIRVLIIAHKRAVKSGKKVRIVEMSEKVNEILGTVGILPLFG